MRAQFDLSRFCIIVPLESKTETKEFCGLQLSAYFCWPVSCKTFCDCIVCIDSSGYIFSTGKCHSLNADRSGTYSVHSACMGNVRCEVSGVLSRGSRVTKESFLFHLWICLHYWLNLTKLTPLLSYAVNAGVVNFEENYSIGTRDTGVKLLCSPSKVPFIFDRSHRNLPYT